MNYLDQSFIEMLASNPEANANDVFEFYELTAIEKFVVVTTYGDIIAKGLRPVFEHNGKCSINQRYANVKEKTR